ncbi:MAG TPA: M56 family metallopeptidase [Rhodanobacteraceae bacterium]|jgi:TonB family protein|nr:M56 family metallopeptidase [Rhodanobacteraceae bacterium]
MNAAGIFSIAVAALGWSLLHFVWQAAIVGVVYALVRGVLPRGNPRYLAAMLAMVAMAVCPLVTAWHEAGLHAAVVDLPAELVSPAAAGISASATAFPDWQAWLGAMMPWLVLGWAAGVGVLGTRVCRQCRGLRSILRAAGVQPEWQARARAIADRMGLRRVAPVLVSLRVTTPTLIGWVRPAVVLPVAVLARMPAAQVEMVLAHELAHLKRLDPLANLFQVVLETLFFYHPVVHWISRDARHERELCCDALALQATAGERRDFVAALAALAEFRTSHAELALAASGGALAERAWFIAGNAPEPRNRNGGLAFAGLALLGLALVLGVAWRQEIQSQRVDDMLAGGVSALREGLGGISGSPPLGFQLREERPRLAPVPFAVLAAPTPAPVAVPNAGNGRVASPRIAVQDLAPAAIVPVEVAAPVPAGAGASLQSAVQPRAIRAPQPDYPARALYNGEQGRVEIQFALSASGVPREVRVVDTSGSASLDGAALDALSRWRFTPPAVAGRQYRQTFNFELDSAAAAGAAMTEGCVRSTGTHICRQPVDQAADARARGRGR